MERCRCSEPPIHIRAATARSRAYWAGTSAISKRSRSDAVRKMSAFPAQRIGLADRGVLREGLKADIAIFDPETVRDMATFERPHQYAEGVDYVIVNGQVAFEGGKMTAARPGTVLYGPAKAR